ncbi:ATP-binding protein [Pusillimonas sp. ANT_WB101]|uniref:ATP-binding protein n=1 Tax=Pusillimonas sp. ANT_WB101 TaxID=2597356 RepID=UPI002105B994|nr:ATP-binding protein [Pusillimonas sp. ANT_WB101]
MAHSDTHVDGAKAIQDAIGAAQREAAAGRTDAYAKQVFSRAAIPPRFADRRLATFEPHCAGAELALRQAQNYADKFTEVLKLGQSLIFVGDVGSGKTHLASGIAHSIMGQGYTALFSSVIAAVRSVKETYRKDSNITESAAILRLIEPDLLVLDEVGLQFGTDAEKLILFEIINGRYEHMRPSILISNLAMKSLDEYLGARVVDRLREGGGKQIIFDWESYRRKIT